MIATAIRYIDENKTGVIRRGIIMVYKEGHSSYGHCWIEGDGVSFYVYIMDGREKRGPYSSLSDAISEFNRYCV